MTSDLMSKPQYDAIIIGGGPGGSTAATYLAKAGKSVLVLEKAHFPRFHIGESLLPYGREIFEEMGVLPAIEKAGFIIKHGAQFHLGNGCACTKLRFRNGAFTRHTTTFQVERAKFDHILLKHAQESGAEVREGWTVSKFEDYSDGITVEASSDDGQTETFTANFLIDCSGRGNLTGNQEKLRINHEGLRKVALFGHFQGVKLPEGEAAGDTLIVRLKDQWFWVIPTSRDCISVGLVMDQKEFGRSKKTPADLFNQTVSSCPEMTERMKDACLNTTIQVTTDFAYYNRQLVGARLLRVGDAAGFMDPVFSAGVHLAMYSGRLAANTVKECLENTHRTAPLLASYEKRVFAVFESFWEMSRGFYDHSFVELFIQPRKQVMIIDAIVAILAGEIDGGWKIWWRRRLFFLLVKIQKYRALVPRLNLD